MEKDKWVVKKDSQGRYLQVDETINGGNSVCSVCGKDAPFSQRLINGQPAKYTDPVILIGAQESYQARCRHCYIIEQVPPAKQKFSWLA